MDVKYKNVTIYNGNVGTYRSALAMLYCMNVQLNRVIIAASRGLGLSILNHQGGRVNICLCVVFCCGFFHLFIHDTHSVDLMIGICNTINTLPTI